MKILINNNNMLLTNNRTAFKSDIARLNSGILILLLSLICTLSTVTASAFHEYISDIPIDEAQRIMYDGLPSHFKSPVRDLQANNS